MPNPDFQTLIAVAIDESKRGGDGNKALVLATCANALATAELAKQLDLLQKRELPQLRGAISRIPRS